MSTQRTSTLEEESQVMRNFSEAFWTLITNVLTILLAGLIAALLGALTLLAILPTIAHAEACSNASFRTGASSALPDCRAYELVSPVEKNGGFIANESFIGSPEGESIGFTSTTGFAGATSDFYTQTDYQSSRENSSWGTAAQTQSEARFIDLHSFAEPDVRDVSFGNVQTSEQCDQGVATACELERGVKLWLLQEVSQPESDLSLYLTRGDGPLERLGPAVPATASGLAEFRPGHTELEEVNVRGMSADGSHVVVEDPEPAGPNQWSFGGRGALLEYAVTGHAEPMPVVPDPATEENGCPQQLLGGIPHLGDFKQVKNPVSTDGRRIFFTESKEDPEYPQCQGGLFARVDNGEENPHTVPISEPASAECAACDTAAGIHQPAEFVGASEDGSKVFFDTSQPLLDGTGGLYEYDFDAPEGQRVALVVAAAGGVTVQQISEDGSHVYFTSSSVLTEEPSPGVRGRNKAGQPVEAGAVAQVGEPNLYVFEREERYPSGHVGFVATISPIDIFIPKEKLGNATPDGRFLVFASRAQLTPDDSSTASQIFEYDSLTGAMVRVSIGEHGYNNDGNSYLSYPGAVYAESIGGALSLDDSNNAAIPSKNTGTELSFNPSAYSYDLSVSADGTYVFFASPIGLTPQAANRVLVGEAINSIPVAVFARNVYEYHAGEVSLISDGKDLTTHNERSQVHLLGASLSGRDVFFETVDPLVGQDTDSNKDIYDARIGGGFPGPVQPVGCSGDACQGQLSSSPVLLSPGSEFQAGGNPTPAAPAPAVKAKPKVKPKVKKCKRGTALKHGRCVRQKAKKSTRRSK